MKHFYKLLFLAAILQAQFVHAQDFTTTFFAPNIADWNEVAPESVSVTFSSNNVALGCTPEMVMGQSIPFSWYQNILNQEYKWNTVAPNTAVEITIEFEFETGEIFEPTLFPFHNEISVDYNGISQTIALEVDDNFVSPSMSCTFTIDTGDPIFEEPYSRGLDIVFWDRNNIFDDAFTMATQFFIPGDRMINNPLWTTTAPSTPQLILRDPPGDGSFTEIIQGDETCHGHAVSVATDESTEVWASVKLGVSGEVGLLYSSTVDTYLEVSGGLEMGLVHTTVDESKMCISVENNYSTSIEDPIFEANSGDLYIGSAITYAYGVFESVYLESCNLYQDRQLAFLPVSSSDFFIYPESYILNTIIPDLEANLASLTPDTDPYIQAEDNLEVWEQYIQLNAEIKAEAFANQTPVPKSWTAQSAETETVSTLTSEMREVEYNMYIDQNVAIEVGIYAGNNGGSAGARIRSKTSKGSTNSSSNQHETTISYTFADDDVISSENLDSDVFSVDIYKDPTFGTPIFKLNEENTATSCPYEGGYQMHNPEITFESNNSDDLTILDIPNGDSYTFEVDICNDSDFAREYFIKVPLESNLNGLQVSLAGTPINVSDGITTNIIPANTCLEDADVTITQTNGSEVLDYEDIQIVMFTPCQPSFAPTTSIVTFDAYFTNNTTGLNELEDKNDLLSVFPNPNKGQFSVKAEDLKEVSTLEVRDITGRMIYETQVLPNTENLNINLDNASKGIYILTVFNSEVRMTQKVVVD